MIKIDEAFGMKGSLSTATVSDLLLELHTGRRTGVLRLGRQDLKKSVYFVEGQIVFAHSNSKQDRLGETLLRLGKITPEEFDAASVEVIQHGKRLGEALCEKGYLSPGEVISGVHYQLQQIIYSVFDWDQGEYEFLDKDRPVFEDIIVEISTPSLLLEGIRNTTNPLVLKRAYGGDEEQVPVIQEQSPRLSRPEWEFSEETLLACVDGKKSILSIRGLTHLAPIEFDRALCSLLLCGIIHLTPGTPGSPTEPVEEFRKLKTPQQVPVSSVTQPMEPSDDALRTMSEDEMRKVILETAERFDQATDEEVLGVLPDATESEITESYDHYFSLYHPYFQNERFEDLRGKLRMILDRLGDANKKLIGRVRERMLLEDSSPFALELADPFEETADSIPAEPVAEPVVPQNQDTPNQEPATVEQEQTPTEKEWNLSDLQQQIRLHPDDPELLRRYGAKLQQSGKPQEAEKQLLRALELQPQNVENHLALADFYQKQGLRMKAFKHLNIVMQFDPENERAMEMLGIKKKKKALYEISGNPE